MRIQSTDSKELGDTTRRESLFLNWKKSEGLCLIRGAKPLGMGTSIGMGTHDILTMAQARPSSCIFITFPIEI